MNFKDNLFSIVAGGFQIILVILFMCFTDYSKYDDSPDSSNSIPNYHSFFQDVHVMVFVGFGFLMTFLKKYSHSAIGYNLFISALMIQWSTLIGGWLHHAFSSKSTSSTIHVDLKSMIQSDYAAASVLITFGALLGKVSRLQLVVIGIFQVVFYNLNENLIVSYVKVTDIGGSMFIHMFGAYFGLAVAKMIYNEKAKDNEKEAPVYHSDMFAMIGTIFLWIFWPSFNAALLGPGPQQNRAVINTYYSLAASCVMTFVISPLMDKKNRIDMEHVQNATLAGAVAVGTCADLIIRPWGAIVLGMTAGLLSTLGYHYVSPFLLSKLKIHDTCGVHNLHGMPAIVASVAGAIAATVATLDTYKQDLFTIWSARIPTANSTMYADAIALGIKIDEPGMGRNAAAQGGMQAMAIVITLVIAIVGGLLTGLVVKFLDGPTESQLFDDKDYWILPADENGGAIDEKSILMDEKSTAEA